MTNPDARPLMDRLGEAHGALLALAPQGGAAAAALIEQGLAAMTAARDLAAELDATRAELIRMRRYVARHDIPLGECVAWNDLKRRYGTGIDWAAEDGWLEAYEELEAARRDDEAMKRFDRKWGG